VSRPAVFFDTEGTLTEVQVRKSDPTSAALVFGAGEWLTALGDAGYALVVVSSMPGIAFKLFDEDAAARGLALLAAQVRDAGARLTDALYCPHHPSALVARYRVECTCRKPAPGLLLRAAQLHDLDLARSWVVGDTLDDVEAGRRVGAHTVLIDNGGEVEWREGAQRRPHYTVRDLGEAARAILARTAQPPRALTV
jgi:D-glycero-D-manno-heptose 1,7-bisphosphate phosphatase